MIEVKSISKSYGAGRFAKPVIADCSFTVPKHKCTVIIGPSGVGKSTLIRLIAGFEKASHGEILTNGKTVTGPGPDRLVMFQESALFPWMTTERNIAYGPQARNEPKPGIAARAKFLLEKTGLVAARRRYPAQLSGGMQRRAELARALINDPEIMILDEPFRGLDAMTKKLMLEYYVKLSEETPRTNLFVTTDIDEAILLADRLIVMSAAPMRVRAVIDVDLPRPRQLQALLSDDAANALKLQTLSLLHEEAMKSFAGGSRAAGDFIEAYRKRLAAA
jgi:NitT/TauT family transport system ATP-binding protein